MNKESLDKMTRMRLLGMHHAFEACIETHQIEQFTNDELVYHLIQAEWDDRQYRTLQRGLKMPTSDTRPLLNSWIIQKNADWIKTWSSDYQNAALYKKAKIFLSRAVPVPEKVS